MSPSQRGQDVTGQRASEGEREILGRGKAEIYREKEMEWEVEGKWREPREVGGGGEYISEWTTWI